MGGGEGQAIARRFKKQKLLLRKGWSQIARLLAAGEYPLSFAFVHHIEQLKARGAPVEWIKSFDPLPANTRGVSVSAKAAHPNAARLFVDFYLSTESQQIIASMWQKVPGHPEVRSPFGALEDLKIIPLDGRLMIEKAAHYQKIAKEVFWR